MWNLNLKTSALISIIGFLFMGCGMTRVDQGAIGSKLPNGDIIISAYNLITLIPASAGECSTGGTIVISYIDTNHTGVLDSGDREVSRSPVCNGAAGTNGYGAGVLVEAASSLSCAAGGSKITTFVDKNNDSVMNTEDVLTSVTTLCNGVNGTNGVNGSNGYDGADGASANLSVTVASPAQCPNGGFVYTSSVTGQAVPDVNVICNGVNGTNGMNGTDGTDGTNGVDGVDGTDGVNGSAAYSMGAVGPMVPGKSYSACHHDYLYFPDTQGGDRGWLTFRHQANGAADQGIGATGFQIWNVDISNFALISEVGNVYYCNLSWNPSTKVLHYQVVDASDGMQGQSGDIHL